MKIELEMYADEKDGAVALQKLSELANKAKQLGFRVIEAEIEADDDEEDDEEDEEKEEE